MLVLPRYLRGVAGEAELAQRPDLFEPRTKTAIKLGKRFFSDKRVQTSLEPDCDYIGTWMTSGNQIHQLAVIAGPQGKLHHFAFKLTDWNEVGHAADLFSMDEVSIDVGPTRHGITRGQTVYFFDPAGNRAFIRLHGISARREGE